VLIYTSYFANLKSLQGCIPISICGKAPEWYTGKQYKKLAPKYDFFMEWKRNHDNDYYTRCFTEQILSHLDAHHVYDDLYDIANDFVNSLPDDDMRKERQNLGFPNIVVLLCYEKPTEFCHRHLVSNWLIQNDINCIEWQAGEA
jgi:hypothetical protein